ncbi:MAG: DUF4474 domain-containing protein [Clostridia bacterium]|nr:DUF4474 domain-containing protein [Clostridia bacterium]
MKSGKKKTVIFALIAVVILAVAAVAVYLIVSNPDNAVSNDGLVEDFTKAPVVTTIVQPQEKTTEETTETTTVPETTTQSEEESYIEQFLAEAETYTTKVEVTTQSPKPSKPMFHVVTDGTVTDDNSLTGLTGVAKTVGEVVLAAGFRYDKEQGIFYSESESFQRNLGYTSLYDAGAAFFGMYYDTIRLKFNYDKYDWMIQVWKGRYGITTGAEVGIYYKKEGTDVDFYACADDDAKITMSFALYKGDELYMTRGPEPHWWLTGFKLFDMISPEELTLHATFFMDNVEMANALEEAILDLNFVEGVNYQRLGLTMTIVWN